MTFITKISLVGGPLTIPPAYIRIRGVVWEYGDGQPDRETRAFRVVCDSREM